MPQDGTTHTYVREPHCPTASFELVHAAVHAAKELGQPIHVGPVVSSDVFYNPDGGQYQRWSDRGILGVEMEAAILFTLGALRKVQAGCLLTVSDIVVEGEFTRITDDELKAAVDRMTARRARDGHRPTSNTVFLVNPASDNGATGKRWPELAHRAALLGLERRDVLLRARRAHHRARASVRRATAPTLVVAVGGDGTLNETVNGLMRPARRAGARDHPARHGHGLRAHVRHPDELRRRRPQSLLDGRDAHDRRRPRRLPHVGRRRRGALRRQRRRASA